MRTEKLVEENGDFFNVFFESKRRYASIIKASGYYFDSLFKLSGIKLDSNNQKRFEDSKESFIDIIVNHFETNEKIKYVIPNPKENILAQKPIVQRESLTELNKKDIVDIIANYGAAVIFFLGLLKPHNQKIKKEVKRLKIMLTKEEKKVAEEKDKRRTFTIKLMNKIKQIERNNKNAIPRLTQVECVILANRELHIYDESDLIDKFGTPKQLVISIRDSYKAQKNSL